tara:strand:+ start:2236 stop:4365 length:2130 start_codon:yes stop_codon:yes gene_type:complete
MKQILQNLSNGDTSIVEIPSPVNLKNNLIIKSKYSLISSGTEKMLLDFGNSNYIKKALKQPDRVKEVLEKIKTDGIIDTIEAVNAKLDKPIPLGYSNAGLIMESSSTQFNAGDRVVSNGPHAEIVRVPENLCAPIPDSVSDEEASFTVVGAIGLQGIRLINPTLDETIVVVGLGLVGLLTVQILRANGCKVIGIDFDDKRCLLAEEFGAKSINLSSEEDFIPQVISVNKGKLVDKVIIAADTNSNEVIHNSAKVCRQRGKIVLIGSVGLDLRRDDFFQKEITFQVSSSYGPGRYDSNYEEKGQDYPIGFVRWTAKRNFEAILSLMEQKKLNLKPLISHTYNISDSLDAYKDLEKKDSLGILIKYPDKSLKNTKDTIELENKGLKVKNDQGEIRIGLVGAGNFSSRTIIPALKKQKVHLDTILSSQGLNSYHQGKKFSFKKITTNEEAFWKNKDINTVFISSPHNLHAHQTLTAMKEEKHIFLEKPLCLNLLELEQIKETYKKTFYKSGRLLIVDFNRRFSPLIKKAKKLLSSKKEPKTIIYTINAGHVPEDSWIQNMDVGGGRIIGEVCHFLDLIKFLVGSELISFNSNFGSVSQNKLKSRDQVTINLNFSDGSLGIIHYLSNGAKSFQKERIEIFCENSILQLNNFRMMKGYNWPNFTSKRLLKQDKGHINSIREFTNAIRDKKCSPISFQEIYDTSKLAIEISDSLS